MDLACSKNSINRDTENSGGENITKAALYFLNSDNGLVDKDSVLKYNRFKSLV